MYRIKDRGIFIAHPKIASRSIQRALMAEFDAKQIGGRHDVIEIDIDEVKAAGGSVACAVRNPYDVFVSWYFHGVVSNAVRTKRYGKISKFEEWLPGLLRCGNGYIEKGLFYGSYYCDTIVRYENLQEDLNAWLAKIGLHHVELQVKGKATARNGRPYQVFYNEQTRKDITIFAAKELEEFGYEFDPDGEFHLTEEGYYGKI